MLSEIQRKRIVKEVMGSANSQAMAMLYLADSIDVFMGMLLAEEVAEAVDEPKPLKKK